MCYSLNMLIIYENKCFNGEWSCFAADRGTACLIEPSPDILSQKDIFGLRKIAENRRSE